MFFSVFDNYLTRFSQVILIQIIININYIPGIYNFKWYNTLIMCEEGIKVLVEIPQVVEIFNEWDLSIRTDIEKMLKMAQKHNISVEVANKIPIRSDLRKKINQITKYKILKNGAYYLHYDWDKNQKVGGKMAVPCTCYVH